MKIYKNKFEFCNNSQKTNAKINSFNNKSKILHEKLKQKNKIVRLETEVNNSRKVSTVAYDVSILDDDVNFIKLQINHKRGQWTEEEKQFAVNLFYKSFY